MADKIMLGRSVASANISPAFQPYSNVIVTVSSDTWYESSNGDSTGRTLEVTCPWGTQEMANNLLRQIKGYAYQPFSASGAIMNPAAEIGDAVTVDGVYSVISERKIKFGGLMSSEISAPGDEEIDHEYPYLNVKDRQVKREISKNASAVLSVTTEKIEAEVKRATAAEGELSGRLTVAADAITAEVTRAENAEKTLSGQIAVTAENILLSVSDTYATKDSISKLLGKTYVTATSISMDANGIKLSYTKSDGTTETGSTFSIRDQITLESNKDIKITGDHLIVESTNFKLNKSGSISATGSFTTVGSPFNGVIYSCNLSGSTLRFMKDGIESGIVGSTTGNQFTLRAPAGSNINIGRDGSGSGIFVFYDTEYDVLVDGGLKVNGALYCSSNLGQHFYGTGGLTVHNGFNVYGKITLGNGDYIWYYSNGGTQVSGSLNAGGHIQAGDYIYATGNMWCGGTKSRVVDTKDYGMISLYAMESATPVFSDLGSGTLDGDGIAYIFFDPDFMETVELRHEYQVFLTQTGTGAVRRAEKHEDYFIVYGDPGAAFDWLAYCRQRDYESIRLEPPDADPPQYDFEDEYLADEADAQNEEILSEE